DRREHRLVVDELLDAVQRCLAALAIELGALLAEEPVDVGIAAVHVGAAPATNASSRVGALPNAALALSTRFLNVFSTWPLLYAARSSARSFTRMPAACRSLATGSAIPECTASQVKSPASKPLG